VDDAIVDVENVFRRLRENAARREPAPRIQVIACASREVRSSIFYATLLIVLVFVPLLGLTGVEGKLFAPIAVATIVSMLASFLVSLTLIPVLCSLLLNPKPTVEHQETWIVRAMKRGLQSTALRIGLEHPWPVLASLGIAVIAAFSLYPKMGKDFLPSFKEETALIAATSAPGTSLDEMNRISDVIEGVQYQWEELCRRIKQQIDHATKKDLIKPREGVRLVEFYESQMLAKTYLNIEQQPGKKKR